MPAATPMKRNARWPRKDDRLRRLRYGQNVRQYQDEVSEMFALAEVEGPDHEFDPQDRAAKETRSDGTGQGSTAKHYPDTPCDAAEDHRGNQQAQEEDRRSVHPTAQQDRERGEPDDQGWTDLGQMWTVRLDSREEPLRLDEIGYLVRRDGVDEESSEPPEEQRDCAANQESSEERGTDRGRILGPHLRLTLQIGCDTLIRFSLPQLQRSCFAGSRTGAKGGFTIRLLHGPMKDDGCLMRISDVAGRSLSQGRGLMGSSCHFWRRPTRNMMRPKTNMMGPEVRLRLMPMDFRRCTSL